MSIPESLSSAEFDRLIDREGDHIELKAGLGVDRLQEALVAFSNTEGGTVLVGVRDDHSLAGKKLDGGAESKIHAAAMNARDVGRYRIYQVRVDATNIIKIDVSRREEGFAQTSSGRVLVRRGAHNVALFGAELARFITERSLRRFEVTDTGLGLGAAVAEHVTELREAYGWGAGGDDDLVSRLQERDLLTRDENLTFAGSLFLTDPRASLGQPKAVVEVRRYPEGTDEYDRREEFGGPAHRQVSAATGFIADELGQDVVITGVFRHEIPRVPMVVLREAIANAVAHRSYELQGTAVVVELRADRVVVTSPGGLPEPVTVENLRQAQAARNPCIIDVLRRFRLAEDAGQGIDVMQDSMAEALLDPPEFVDDGHAVTVTLPLRSPITPRERAWVADLERRGEITPPDRLLLVHAARGQRLTNAVARDILGVDSFGAREGLQRLRDASLLRQHGRRGGATYTIVDDLAPPAAFRLDPEQLDDLVVAEAARRPISNERVRELTGLDRSAALAMLRRLVREGRLRRTGARRGTRYEALGV